jgi:hypothetical protein
MTECPICGDELKEPPVSDGHCGRCNYIADSPHTEEPLDDVDLTVRQAQRVLEVFSTGTVYSQPVLREYFDDEMWRFDTSADELNDLLADLRNEGDYSGE